MQSPPIGYDADELIQVETKHNHSNGTAAVCSIFSSGSRSGPRPFSVVFNHAARTDNCCCRSVETSWRTTQRAVSPQSSARRRRSAEHIFTRAQLNDTPPDVRDAPDLWEYCSPFIRDQKSVYILCAFALLHDLIERRGSGGSGKIMYIVVLDRYGTRMKRDGGKKKKKLTGNNDGYRRVVRQGATGSTRRFPRTVWIREKKTWLTVVRLRLLRETQRAVDGRGERCVL